MPPLQSQRMGCHTHLRHPLGQGFIAQPHRTQGLAQQREGGVALWKDEVCAAQGHHLQRSQQQQHKPLSMGPPVSSHGCCMPACTLLLVPGQVLSVVPKGQSTYNPACDLIRSCPSPSCCTFQPRQGVGGVERQAHLDGPGQLDIEALGCIPGKALGIYTLPCIHHYLRARQAGTASKHQRLMVVRTLHVLHN